MKLRPASIVALLLPAFPLAGAVFPYPDPPNAEVSSSYSMAVDGAPVTVMHYMDYHYAHFAFDGSIQVSVATPDPITSFRISPAGLGIQGEVLDETTLSFTLDAALGIDATPTYLVIDVAGREKLVILADPPESDVPASNGPGIFNVVSDFGADASGATYTQPDLQQAIDAASAFGSPAAPGIVYVPPGLYQVRSDLLLKDNVDFYLAPGSVIKADEDVGHYSVQGGVIGPVLVVDNAENVTIRGRGEVDASGIALMDLLSRTPPVFVSQSNDHPRRRILRTNNGGTSRNVRIDGILCKDATGWSVELKRTLGITARHVKVLNHKDINWKIENDGINVCSSSDAVVNQCFVMTIDDAGCAKASDAVMGSMDHVLFSNNVLWTWSAGAKAGMQNDHPMNDVVFRNLEVVHCRRAVAVDTKTSQDMGKAIPIEGVRFEDIHVEEIEGHWNIANHDALEFILEDADANDITIRNLRLPENRPLRCGPRFQAHGVSFVNLVMGSELITDVSQVTVTGSQPIHDLTFTTQIPDIHLAGPATHDGSDFTVAVQFSMPVTELALSDFQVTHGSASKLEGGPSLFTLTVHPDTNGWIQVTLPADSAQSSAAMGNLASETLDIARAAAAIALPTTASAPLELHVSADDLALADGATVSEWPDAVRPRSFTGTATFEADFTHGIPGVRFNGTNDQLSLTGIEDGPDTGQVTILVLGAFSTEGNDAVSDFMISSQFPDGSTNNRLRIFKRGNDGRIDARVGGGSTISGSTTDTAPHVFGLVAGRTPGSVDFLMDGRTLNTGSSGNSAAMQALFLGAYGTGGNQFFEGTVSEVLLFRGALSETDSAAVQDYLFRKYFGHALDTDRDGLPDAWEYEQFGGLSSTAGGASDADGDGFTDEDEWLAGTRPADGSSIFSSTLHPAGPGSLELTFFAIPDRRYTLEVSPDLQDWVENGTLDPVQAPGVRSMPLAAPPAARLHFARIRADLE
ncbi:glycosyl hydrolase family 28-related protein [Haloferula sargassicola]|uniref:Rhamnogalacturonase A/B/Epimerase-like pectate lyase domain-containing protein n=1 Tax=Haloferula sargassicola TaxID=490096 RepID=A0ABP9UNQ9_9BACT